MLIKVSTCLLCEGIKRPDNACDSITYWAFPKLLSNPPLTFPCFLWFPYFFSLVRWSRQWWSCIVTGNSLVMSLLMSPVVCGARNVLRGSYYYHNPRNNHWALNISVFGGTWQQFLLCRRAWITKFSSHSNRTTCWTCTLSVPIMSFMVVVFMNQ